MTQRKTTSTNYENEQFFKTDCPMQYALSLIGGRWKMMLVWYIHLGINRFSELQRYISQISSKMLTQQLGELQESNLIVREIILTRPLNVQYRLSERGHSLVPVLEALKVWGEQDRIDLY